MKRQHPPIYYHIRFIVRGVALATPGIIVTILMHGKAFLG